MRRKYYYGKPDGYALICRTGKKSIYAQWYDMRIEGSSIPEGKFMYQCADYDGTGEICRIQPYVMVDFFGTIVTDEPLEFNGPLDDPERHQVIFGAEDYLCWIDKEEYEYGQQATH